MKGFDSLGNCNKLAKTRLSFIMTEIGLIFNNKSEKNIYFKLDVNVGTFWFKYRLYLISHPMECLHDQQLVYYLFIDWIYCKKWISLAQYCLFWFVWLWIVSNSLEPNRWLVSQLKKSKTVGAGYQEHYPVS